MTEQNKIPNIDWMIPSQLDILYDRSKTWTKQTFRSSAAYWVSAKGATIKGKISEGNELPPDAIIEDKGWDHEHCAFCYETISEYPDYQHEGYTDGKDWLCIKCYSEYILPQTK